MAGKTKETEAVEAWLRAVRSRVPAGGEVRLFEQAFRAIWDGALLTLGEVSMTVIADRVLHSSLREFPNLAEVSADANGFHLDRMRTGAAKEAKKTEQALAFLLSEFLAVIEKLTAGVISQRLYACLNEIDGADQENKKT